MGECMSMTDTEAMTALINQFNQSR
ncbi:acetyl-CoA carboxylase biotin carboxyl carrier protein subunit, partial [Vitellibacter sp. q18]|nr:acetyl-CoA carboxylase biotin carboxyl carrier protein subunit [Aequorivita lutea]